MGTTHDCLSNYTDYQSKRKRCPARSKLIEKLEQELRRKPIMSRRDARQLE